MPSSSHQSEAPPHSSAAQPHWPLPAVPNLGLTSANTLTGAGYPPGSAAYPLGVAGYPLGSAAPHSLGAGYPPGSAASGYPLGPAGYPVTGLQQLYQQAQWQAPPLPSMQPQHQQQGMPPQGSANTGVEAGAASGHSKRPGAAHSTYTATAGKGNKSWQGASTSHLRYRSLIRSHFRATH